MAEGFDVSTDVIRRVLKSKFVPTLKQKLKQDQKVMIKAGFAPASGDVMKSLSAGHSVSGLLPPGDEVSSKNQTHSTPGAQKSQKERTKRESLVPTPAAMGHQRKREKHTTSDSEAIRRDDGDRVPSVEKLGELKAGEPRDQNFTSEVVQRGREFFDSNGNFLYRI